MPGIATPLVRVSGTPKPKPAKASRSISGWPKSNPRTMLTTPPGTRTGTETGTVTAVPMRRPGDWSPTTRGPARIAPARRWPPSPRAPPVDAPPRRPLCMFATATDLPHSKHRECNHDARSSSWSASRVDRDGHDDGESSWPGRRVVLSWGGASPAQLAGCRVLAVTVVTARSVACSGGPRPRPRIDSGTPSASRSRQHSLLTRGSAGPAAVRRHMPCPKLVSPGRGSSVEPRNEQRRLESSGQGGRNVDSAFRPVPGSLPRSGPNHQPAGVRDPHTGIDANGGVARRGRLPRRPGPAGNRPGLDRADRGAQRADRAGAAPGTLQGG